MFIYTATGGFIDEYPVEDAKRFVVGLGEFLETRQPEILSAIRTSGELSAETEVALKSAIDAFASTFRRTETGPGSSAALGETTPPDEVKPDVGWDRMSSVEEPESADPEAAVAELDAQAGPVGDADAPAPG